MSLNLEKYKESLLAAWKDVTDYKSSTDWALFGYEGQTNDLKLVAKGDGGIEEMQEDLNDGKIMYAFCKVHDPKTSLNKFVLVHWQGEGAPHHRKATSANHIRDVSNFFKGFHLTVNARNEEEAGRDIIIEKLSKASASNYSFKTRGESIENLPVGSTYKRVIPQQEIDSIERDKFWQKEEEEEKQRQEAEKRRREEEKKIVENATKQREIEEANKREAKIKERSKSISFIREVERNKQMQITAANIVKKESDLEEREKEEIERKDRSEILRRQRSQEAQVLISKRTIDARAVFEQSTSVGQRLQRRASHQPTTNTVSDISCFKISESSAIEEDSSTKQLETPTLHTSCLLPEVVQCPNTDANDTVHVDNNLGEKQTLNGKAELSTQGNDLDSGEPLDRLYMSSTMISKDYEELDLRAEALYDYQAADDTEISFDPGDIITRIDQIDAGWWQGMAPDGSYGLFPANYVQLLEL